MPSSSLTFRTVANLTGPRGGKIVDKVSFVVTYTQHTYFPGIAGLREFEARAKLPLKHGDTVFKRFRDAKVVTIKGMGNMLITDIHQDPLEDRVTLHFRSTGPFKLPPRSRMLPV